MTRNLSIAAKLLKRQDPSLAAKRRVHAVHFPVVTHVGDVVRFGSGHIAQKVASAQFQVALHLTDRAGLVLSLTDSIFELAGMVFLNFVESTLQSVRLTTGRHNAVLHLTDKVSHLILSSGGIHNPELHLSDAGSIDAIIADGEHRPHVVLEDLMEQGVSMNQGQTQPELSLADKSRLLHSIAQGDFRPMVFLNEKAVNLVAIDQGQAQPELSLEDKSRLLHAIANGDFDPKVVLNDQAASLFSITGSEYFLEIFSQQLTEKVTQAAVLKGGGHNEPIFEIVSTDKVYSQILLGDGDLDLKLYAPDFWFEADAVTGKVNNDAITALIDLSGDGNDLTAVNGPAYKTNVVKGLPAFRFDGVNDVIYRATFTQGDWAQPSSFLAVYREDTTEGTAGFIFDGRDSVKRNARVTQAAATPDSIHLFAGTSAYNVVTAPKNRWRVEIDRFNGSSSKVALSGVDSGWTANPNTQPMKGITFGAQYDNATPIRAYIAVLAGWNRLLSNSEVSAISSHYMAKYADLAYAGTKDYGFGGAAQNRFSGGGAAAHPTAWSQGGWVRVAAPAVTDFCLIARSNGTPATALSHILQTVASTQRFRGVMFDGAGKTITGGVVIEPDRWYHVILCGTNAGTLKLYVNGLLDGKPVAIGTMWAAGNDWWFSPASSGAFVLPFQGSMCDMTIWNRELTAGEVATLAAGAVGAAATLHSANHIVRLPMQDGTMNEAIGANWTESVGGLTQTRTADVTIERGDGIAFQSVTTDHLGTSAPLAWFEADKIVGRVEADPVETWADNTANGNDVTQSTLAKRPLYRASAKNSLPALEFDGSNDWLRRATWAGGAISQPGTVMAIYNMTNVEAAGWADAFGAATIYDGPVNSNRWVRLTNPLTTPDTIHLWAGTDQWDSIVQPKNLWIVEFVVWNGASSKVWLNGNVYGWAPNPGAGTFNGITIGAHWNETIPMRGLMAALCVWNRALSTAELRNISLQMMTKYAIR